MRPDYYAILGVGRTATLIEIRSAYRRKAKETHPTAGGTDEAFIALKKAHDTLVCLEARAAHNRDLDSRALTLVPEALERPDIQPDRSRKGSTQSSWTDHDLAWAKFEWERLDRASRPAFEVFERLRTAERVYARATKNTLPPLNYPVGSFTPELTVRPVATLPVRVTAYRTDGDPAFTARIALQQCYEGVRVYLCWSEKIRCVTCEGMGFNLVDGPQCPLCCGTGYAGHRGFIGRLVLGDPCGNCGGRGKIKVPKDCMTCKEGVATVWHQTTVDVERGAVSGSVLSLPGSDDKVEIQIHDTHGFKRQGDDLLLTKIITPKQAKEGCALTVDWLDGSGIPLRVPAGSADGSVLTIPRRGMPRPGGAQFGDLLVTLSINSSSRRRGRPTG